MFPSYPECEKCTLCEQATNRGLPTRPWKTNGNRRALLVVGEAPGYYEDQDKRIWIGRTGQLLDRLLEQSGLIKYVDIYLSNICRCRPPLNGNPSKKQIETCTPYLIQDIIQLKKHYPDGITILACGRQAAKGLGGFKTLNDSFKAQGAAFTSSPGIPLFFTYHPAALLPATKRGQKGRSPAKIHAVEAHFVLLLRYLRGEFIPNSLKVVPELGAKPLQMGKDQMVAVDIETYGILKGQEQTVFHPVKSLHIDGVPIRKQVITVSFAYRDGDTVRTPIYLYHKPWHRELVRRWFKNLASAGGCILGQNVKFDLLYLTATDVLIKYLINKRNIRLEDTLLLSFLLYEQQPERGLKELSTLFGVSDYRNVITRARNGTFTGPHDPALHQYNCLDSATTLVLAEELWNRIERRYGGRSPKFSAACRRVRNAVLWGTLDLEEKGCVLDTVSLRQLDAEMTKECDAKAAVLAAEGVIVEGTGSQKSSREFVQKALTHAGLIDNSKVEVTKKKKEISISVANLSLAYNHLEEGSLRDTVDLFKQFKQDRKIITSYTNPILTAPVKGIVRQAGTMGYVYPSWYAVPMYTSHEGQEGETPGGTIQARYSCRKPGAQTFPPPVEKCLTSRFIGGKLCGYDLSQIELRMAALLSGDTLLMEAYESGSGKLHTQSALIIFPDADPTASGWDDSNERQLGKTLNFLVVYRGGPEKYQETALRRNGIELALSFCKEAIHRWDVQHREFRLWQDSLFDKVVRQGYLELPTGWSRTFGKGKANANTYINEICNFPIQAISAQLLQSAHFEILKDFHLWGLTAVIPLQVHDSLVVDMPAREEKKVDEIMDKWLTNPPVLDILKGWLGRTIPILYSKKVISDGRFALEGNGADR